GDTGAESKVCAVGFWPVSAIFPPAPCTTHTDLIAGITILRLAGRALGILQGEPQLLGQVVDRRPLSLPGAVGLEAQRTDTAAPRRNDPADGAVVGAIGVMLVDLL